MENPEEVLQLLERFTKLKQKEIPRELEDYLSFVARTGDTNFPWAIVKHLFREKLVHVITDFHDNTPSIADLPQCPNVDPFNYERMKRTLLERLDAFNSAPFTVQRICELLTEPRKQYTRIDKFMRAVEKNILVVSTQEPGRRRSESENGDSLDSIVNGDLEVNVDIEMDNEAFGIDSSEMVTNSASAASTATAAAASSPSEETSSVLPSATPAAELQEADKDATPLPEAAATDNGNDDEAAVESEPKSDDSSLAPAVAEESNGIDEPANDKVTSSLEEADTPKDDSKPVEEAAPLEEKTNSAQHEAAEDSDAVDSAVTESHQLEPLEPAEKEVNDDPQPQSHDANEATKEASDDRTTDNGSKANEVDDELDDGQPQAKLAKLSEKPAVVVERVEPKETLPSVTAEPVDTEKDEISSGSTTDSGGSSTSVDSESVSPPSTDNSTSNSVETIESAVTLAESSQAEKPQAAVEENPPKTDESSEGTSDVRTPVDAEVPKSPEVADPVVPAVTEVKPLDAEVEPTTAAYVAPDEMETASSALIPESVMATDEEETNHGAADSVVPMAADVPEVAKTDDNEKMDVDESSVEPMDQ